ncbi:vitamin-D-receptor interacting mediator subunit 4-domain-containing protein [Spinellus fusiger]|nr:vitamin-D-receptor interacting mediator subunit 4-domain-containing protein [Spinellus fusiger]
MASSLRDQVNTLLTEYAGLVKSYFHSLSLVAENTPVDEQHLPERLLKKIVTVDKALQQAIESIDEHQAQQRRIAQVQDEIQRYQMTMLEMVQRLNEANEELQGDLTLAKKEIKVMQHSKDSQFTEILSYASKLSKYTSAPPNFELMNRDIKVEFEKPYPDEEKMRRGQLYWQHASQPMQEDQFESSDSDSSMDEQVSREVTTAGLAAEESQSDPLWILDLNPDMPS